MSISFDSYKVFYYVAKYRNITTAAKALFLTQPTVSHAILSLEKALECQLFVRSKKGVALTPEAELLYGHIARACEHIWEGERALGRHLSMDEGLVRIGASETTLHHFLMPYLEHFRAIHPHVRLKISNTTTPTAVSSLKNGLIDFAVIVSPESDSALTIRTLSPLQDVFIAGNHYLPLKGKVIPITDLGEYPLVCMEKGTTTREYLEEAFQKYQMKLIPDIELATTDLITPMVARNLGIGFVPYAFAKDALEEGTVFPLQIATPLPQRNICLVHDSSASISVAGKELYQMLTETEAGFVKVP